MRKKTIGKLLTAVLLTAMLVASAFGLSGCNKGGDTKYTPENYTMPSGLDDYAGEIEWVNELGEKTDFNNIKPVVILFHGISDFNLKESYSLDSNIYTYDSATSEGGLDLNARDINKNLAFYWRQMGFNVGVFHVEAFTDDTHANVVKKIFDKGAVSYKNKAGETIEGGTDFSLTDLFVSRFLKLMENKPINGSVQPNRIMEIRFIGNSTGAILALSAAEALNTLYSEGKISGNYVPTRITLTNPYLSNDSEKIGDYNSVLEYVSAKLPVLADKGAVFELIESDFEFYNSYAKPYTGLLVDTEGEGESAVTKVTLGSEGDSLLYKNILRKCAYLPLRESYSNAYTDSYKKYDRAALDWYLYSVFGSDDSTISTSTNAGYNNSRPMLDDRNGGGSQSVSRYSVSAWTPTSFTRALRGVEFNMSKRTYDGSGNYVFKDYTLNKLATESYQISNLSGVKLCGYVYSADDGSSYINYGLDKRLSDVEIRVVITDGNNVIRLDGRSGLDGFYSIDIDAKYYEKTITVEIVTPNKNYRHADNITSDVNDYIYLSMNRIYANANNISISLSSAKSLLLFRNCGMIKSV